MTDLQFLLCKLSETCSDLGRQIVICHSVHQCRSSDVHQIHQLQLHEQLDEILVIVDALNLSQGFECHLTGSLSVAFGDPDDVAVYALEQTQKMAATAIKAAQFGLDSDLPAGSTCHREALHHQFAVLMQLLTQLQLQTEIEFSPCAVRQQSAKALLQADFQKSRQLGLCIGGNIGLDMPAALAN